MWGGCVRRLHSSSLAPSASFPSPAVSITSQRGGTVPCPHPSISQLYLHPVSTLRAVAHSSGGGCWLTLGSAWPGAVAASLAALALVLACRLVFLRSGVGVGSAVLAGGCPVARGPRCGQSGHHSVARRRRGGCRVVRVGVVWVRTAFAVYTCDPRAAARGRGAGAFAPSVVAVVPLCVPRFTGLPSPPWCRFREFIIIPLSTLRAGARSSGARVGIAVGRGACFLG